jgi:hypothetical protein
MIGWDAQNQFQTDELLARCARRCRMWWRGEVPNSASRDIPYYRQARRTPRYVPLMNSYIGDFGIAMTAV